MPDARDYLIARKVAKHSAIILQRGVFCRRHITSNFEGVNPITKTTEHFLIVRERQKRLLNRIPAHLRNMNIDPRMGCRKHSPSISYQTIGIQLSVLPSCRGCARRVAWEIVDTASVSVDGAIPACQYRTPVAAPEYVIEAMLTKPKRDGLQTPAIMRVCRKRYRLAKHRNAAPFYVRACHWALPLMV